MLRKPTTQLILKALQNTSAAVKRSKVTSASSQSHSSEENTYASTSLDSLVTEARHYGDTLTARDKKRAEIGALDNYGTRWPADAYDSKSKSIYNNPLPPVANPETIGSTRKLGK